MMAGFGNTEINNNFGGKNSFSKLEGQSQSGVGSKEKVR